MMLMKKMMLDFGVFLTPLFFYVWQKGGEVAFSRESYFVIGHLIFYVLMDTIIYVICDIIYLVLVLIVIRYLFCFCLHFVITFAIFC